MAQQASLWGALSISRVVPFRSVQRSSRILRVPVVNSLQCGQQCDHTSAAAAAADSPADRLGQLKLHNPLLLSLAALLTTTGAAHAAADATQLYSLAELDASAAHTFETFLRPLFAVFTFLYIIRIPMTWYPSIDGSKFPWVLAYAPTEPVLRITRNVIPLVGGVDVTPIVWVGLISFFNEILLGPQGILMLIQRESGSGLL